MIRDYAWGSTTAIPDLLGVPRSGEPQAEMWLGAHPDSPSVTLQGRLDEVIAQDPRSTLGDAGERLPFLMKVLAAGAPLSLQVHPSEEAAAAGYAAEQEAGVPQDAPHRRYKDPHHKPEMVMALTDFTALCGLRSAADALELIGNLPVEHPGWSTFIDLLRGDDGVRAAFAHLLQEADPSLMAAVADACAAQGPAAPVGIRTVPMLNDAYPGDPGVVASLLLNCVELKPGEALYLPAGNIHAYLDGLAIEVLASSDNVLRAGLTPKHIDVPEVLRTVDFSPLPVPYVEPEVDGPTATYRPGAREFGLVMVDLARADGPVTGLPATGPRIVLALDDAAVVTAGTQTLNLAHGGSVFVADADGALSITGTRGRIAVARLPSALER